MTTRESIEHLFKTLSAYKDRCNSEWCEKDKEALGILTRELPTMQSNLICVYCERSSNAPLMTSNVETNICWQCGASHQWCMFKGKTVAEVEE